MKIYKRFFACIVLSNLVFVIGPLIYLILNIFNNVKICNSEFGTWFFIILINGFAVFLNWNLIIYIFKHPIKFFKSGQVL
jgi:hypothetical protein